MKEYNPTEKEQTRNQVRKPNLSDKAREKLNELKPFWETFDNETDRAIGIVSVCLLDHLLEKLIRASYVKEPQVKSLFKNDHILQSFFAKINIAYFSGLIPKAIYHDLKLICEIRNVFAHAVIADLKFTDKAIAQRIDRFTQIPKTVSNLYPPKLKFILVVAHIASLLLAWEDLLSLFRPPNLVELCGLEKTPFHEAILRPEEIRCILQEQLSNIARKE